MHDTCPPSCGSAETLPSKPVPVKTPPWDALVATAGALLFCAGLYYFQHTYGWPFPSSDLLRNTVSYAWGYDYRAMFPLAQGQPAFNPFLGFDVALGWVTQVSSPATSARVAQTVFASLFVLTVWRATQPLAWPRVSAALVITLTLSTMAITRFVEARPEMGATLWLLLALSTSPRRWLAVGAVVCTTYWLTPVYAVGAFLLPVRWGRRLRYFLFAGSAFSLYWLATAGPNWLVSLEGLRHMASARLTPTWEDAALWTFWTLDPLGAAMLGAVALRTVVGTPRAALIAGAKFLVPLGFFLVAGKVRHLIVVAPLLLLWSLHTKPVRPWFSSVHPSKWRELKRGMGVAAWLAVAALASYPASKALSRYAYNTPVLKLPANSYVLTLSSPSVFFLPFNNPGTVRVVPSWESGYDSPESLRVTKALATGALTCTDLTTHKFTHVVSHARSAPLTLPCLRKVTTYSRWILWEVGEHSPAQ